MKSTQSEKEKLLEQQLAKYKYNLELSEHTVAKLEKKCQASSKELNDAIMRSRLY